MRRYLLLLFFVLAFCFASGAEARKFALLVGVDEYVNVPSLHCCVNDMKTLKTALMKIGFAEDDIQVLVTGGAFKDLPTKKNIERNISKILLSAQPTDIVFLAFSGHGAQDGSNVYFCPPDVETDDLKGTCVSINKVMDILANKCNAQFKWMVVDACRNDPGQSSKGIGGKGLQVIPTPPAGIALFQSCAEGEESWEDRASGNGFFTKNFVAALSGEADANHDGKLTLMEVCSWTTAHTKEQVKSSKNKSQRPYFSGSVSDFTLTEDLNVPKARKLVEEARKAVEEEKFGLAVQKYDEAIALCPRFSSIRRERDVANKMLKMSTSPASPLFPVQTTPSVPLKAGDRQTCTVNGVEFAFRYCPPGTFMMGSPTSEANRKIDETQHLVTLTKGFWMMETEVTQKQWKAIMGTNPSDKRGDNLPVESVTWKDCQEFCKKCSALGLPVQLPTEAQWEYACRAGTRSAFSGVLRAMAHFNDEEVFSAGDDSSKRSQPVGKKKPNAWGLYDMHGNVWEWCQDWYGDYPDGSVTDPRGPSSGSNRILRGGGWKYGSWSCRSASRFVSAPENQYDFLGFRCVVMVSGAPPAGSAVAGAPSPGVQQPSRPIISFSKQGAKPGDRKTCTIKGVEFAFRYCPPGSFMMGSPESEKNRYDNEVQHRVTLTKGFWMMETEVTKQQWRAIMGTNPGAFKGNNLPIENVSWEDCQEFCRKCTELGLPIRLPTEAQWEYACRAGSTGTYAGKLNDMAWFNYNSNHCTHPVGTKKPNAWGLYDMHGNVWEWCEDWYESDFFNSSDTDPTGPSSGTLRVGRGGSWDEDFCECRSASRNAGDPLSRNNFIGFRCVGITSDATPAVSGAPKPNVQQPSRLLISFPKQGVKAGDRKTCTINGVEFAFRYCPPGSFMMGSPESEEGRFDNEKQHPVTLTKGFWMMETEVTQKQWQAIMKNNRSYYMGDDLPVENVSWNDCQEFCMKCTQLGLPVQLPTEAQWEYACRAGSTGARAGNLDEMAWYSDNSNYETHFVGSKKPNAWGLYDMYGNVLEWCQDYWKADYPSGTVIDPVGPSGDAIRVFRGGCWINSASGCRSAYRYGSGSENRLRNLGFRVVQS